MHEASKKKQDIYDSLIQAESDPITAGLVKSYLRRQGGAAGAGGASSYATTSGT